MGWDFYASRIICPCPTKYFLMMSKAHPKIVEAAKSVDRIDKILANLGYCTRRQVSDFLQAHSVTANGKQTRDGAVKSDPHGMLIDGAALDHPNGIFILLNKPAGYVCSHDSAEGKRVYDLLPPQWMKRNPLPATIGRLDKDTTGVILITDQPHINHRLSSPRSVIDKVYQATLDKPLSPECIGLFSSGSMLLPGEAKPCLPALLRITGEATAEVTLREGRYHQVKRMFLQFGSTVVALHRSNFGPYSAEGIAEGAFVEVDIETVR
jgi:16S rRNA pseudouridine516 synthase